MRPLTALRSCTAPLLTLALSLADTPTARAQQPAPRFESPSPPATAQLATEAPRRPRRPSLDPATRELRKTQGLLAGGIVLAMLCGAGFGLVTWAIVDSPKLRQGRSHAIESDATLFACTVMSIAASGVAGRRLRTLKHSGRVSWAGGLGLRF